MGLLEDFEAQTGVRFRTLRMLKAALGLSEDSHAFPNQQSLAYVGDSMIELVLREYLVAHYAQDEWSRLGILRGRGASNIMLGHIACECKIDQFSNRTKVMSHPEKRLGTLFEAVVGALIIDRGYRAARKFLEREYLSRFPLLINEVWEKDPVLQLNDILAQSFCTKAEFVHKGRAQGGEVVVAMINGREYLRTTGETVGQATQEVASMLLERIKNGGFTLRR